MQRGPDPKNRRREMGFTLIEALIVLVLMGIAVAMAASLGQGPRVRAELRSTAQDLEAFLTGAAELASKRGETVVVRYNATARRFEMGTDGGSFTVLRRWSLPRGVVVTSIDWPTVSGFQSLECDPLGRQVDAGSGMTTTPRTVELTHELIQRGTVGPNQVVRVVVYPVWSVKTFRIRL